MKVEEVDQIQGVKPDVIEVERRSALGSGPMSFLAVLIDAGHGGCFFLGVTEDQSGCPIYLILSSLGGIRRHTAARLRCLLNPDTE